MNPRKDKCECVRRNHCYNTYPYGSWAELSLQLLPLYPTFSSTFLSHPVCAPSYQRIVCESPTRRFLPEKRQQSLVKPPQYSPDLEEKRWEYVHFFLLYPSGFASCANPALCSSPRQHPHRHLPLGARLLSSGRLETAVPKRGKDLRTAPGRGGDGGRRGRTAWQVDLHAPTISIIVRQFRGNNIEKVVY